MKVIIACFALLSVAYCGIIHHDEGDDHGYGKATSYQNVHLEAYHPVPVYIKKEDYKYLEHPVHLGSIKTEVKIEHGDKHDHGYAIVNTHNGHHEALSHYGGELEEHEGLGGYGGHEELSGGEEGGYEGYEHHE